MLEVEGDITEICMGCHHRQKYKFRMMHAKHTTSQVLIEMVNSKPKLNIDHLLINASSIQTFLVKTEVVYNEHKFYLDHLLIITHK